MTFVWAEFLSLAEELAGQRPATPAGQEARLRSAISRAYYSAFISARNFVRDKHGRTFPANRSHEALQDWFLAATDDRLKKIGSELNRLRDFRRKADYDDVVKGLDQT